MLPVTFERRHGINSANGLAVYPPGAAFNPRRMHDFEFVWIIDGNCIWHSDDRDIPAPPGTIILSRPGMRDAYTWDPHQQTRHAFIHFYLDPAHAEPALPPPDTWPLTRQPPSGDILRPLFRHAIWLLDRHSPSSDELARQVVFYMVTAFVHGALQSKGEGSAALPLPVERALQHVQQRWRRGPMHPPSLDELATVAGVSAPHLCRLFKDALGEPPMRTLLYLRLERAATLLSRTNMRLQEIATVTGFANQFHFSRAFRSVFGVPPRDFRQDLASENPNPTPMLLRIRRATSYLWDPL